MRASLLALGALALLAACGDDTSSDASADAGVADGSADAGLGPDSATDDTPYFEGEGFVSSART